MKDHYSRLFLKWKGFSKYDRLIVHVVRTCDALCYRVLETKIGDFYSNSE